MSPEVKNYCESHGWKPMSTSEQSDITDCKEVLIVLIPAWSKKDFDIIDTVARKISSASIDIRVYDIDDFQSQEEIQRFFPMVPSIIQTPVLAFYADGDLKSFLQGENTATWSPDK